MAEPDFKEMALRLEMVVPFSVETNGLVWMAVHGTLCLGLRHPGYTGPSRQFALQFVHALGQQLVKNGVLTAEELALVERTEQQESPHK